MSNSLQPHGLQHSRPPYPSPAPGACSNSCPSNRWCHPTIHPLSSPSPPALNLSQHQDLFQWVGSLHQVAKVLVLHLQHQSFQWIFRLISFRIDWFDLAVQETFKNLLKHCSSKVSVFQHLTIFMVQLSHLLMTTGKTIALTLRTFVDSDVPALCCLGLS